MNHTSHLSKLLVLTKSATFVIVAFVCVQSSILQAASCPPGFSIAAACPPGF
jgi:hypothetical protein